MSHLISTADLAKCLNDANICILDATWHLPTAKRNAMTEFTEAHIPGAQFFDLDHVSEQSTPLPHMLPPQERFAALMTELGAGSDKQIVTYDSVGLFSAARCWWMFRHFGHPDVKVLDGGLKKWMAEGHPTQSGVFAAQSSHFSFGQSLAAVRSMADVLSVLQNQTAQVADARSPTRFRGEEPEPRPGVKPGHMRGAFNVHYATLLNFDGTLKCGEELRTALAATGLDLDKPVITSCGSGVTAAIISLALAELGHTDNSLYDGSWAEWGASGNEIVYGP